MIYLAMHEALPFSRVLIVRAYSSQLVSQVGSRAENTVVVVNIQKSLTKLGLPCRRNILSIYYETYSSRRKGGGEGPYKGQMVYTVLRQQIIVFYPLALTDRKVRTVESMRQLAAQLAEAERVALEADKTIAAADASRTPTVSSDTTGSHHKSMLSDTYGRHHNYLRISLTERQEGRGNNGNCLL